jgi:hypothetical protein
LTQNQLIELIESEQVKALVERSEERGVIEPAEFEAFVLEHDLTEDETEQLTRELETLGLEVAQSRAAKDKAERKPRRRRRRPSRPPSRRHRRRGQPAALPRRRRPPQAVERRPGVQLAKLIERGDPSRSGR